jgi:hypothetical protein
MWVDAHGDEVQRGWRDLANFEFVQAVHLLQEFGPLQVALSMWTRDANGSQVDVAG